jgi:hypothetical protein
MMEWRNTGIMGVQKRGAVNALFSFRRQGDKEKFVSSLVR